jgi:hypothetical protein
MGPQDRSILETQLIAQLTDIEREISKLEKQRER